MTTTPSSLPTAHCPLPTATVLVVEDDEGLARLQCRRLERAGYAVVTATTAAEGQALVERGGVDLILLDQGLPGDVSGLELFRRLKVAGHDVPAIMVTGYNGENIVLEALRAGVRDFVPKTPDYLDHLLPAVTRVLKELGIARQLAETDANLIREQAARAVVEQANVSLRESAQRFRFLAESMPQKIFTAKPNGDVDYFNQQWMEFTGLTFEQIKGWGWKQFIHPDDVEETVRRWQHTIDTGEPLQIEHRFRRADGAYHWHLSRAVAMRDATGKVLMWVGSNTDIEDVKRSEEALRRGQERFDLVIEATDLGVWYCDLPFDELMWNEQCKEHFFLPPDARVTIDTFYDRLHPDDRERTRQAIDRSISDRAGYDIEYRTVAPDGRERWLRAIGRGFYDAAGKPIHFDGVTVDVTAQKRAEEDLRATDRRKDEFLAMLAHELRNPLAPIRNALYLARVDGPQSQEIARRAYGVIERQVEQMVRLVDDLLDMSRITRDKINLQKECVDLASVVARAVESSQPLIDARHHTLNVVLPKEALPVEADPVRLAQVLLNLLNNAAKYTPEGGHIGLEAERRDDQAVVRVRDTGMGIPRHMLPKVFDLFTQADRTLDRADGGLGIGLTLVRRLTEMHGGTVEAFSAGPGQGSTFTIHLPLLKDEGGRMKDETKTESGSDSSFILHPSSLPLRILVVDDNRDSAESLAMLLKLHGSDVRTAYDGRLAVAAAEAYQPDVVLLDIGLPGLDGYEVARRLRALPALSQTVLVALTGYGSDDDRRRSREAGFNAHLVKPVDLEALQALLGRPDLARQVPTL